MSRKAATRQTSPKTKTARPSRTLPDAPADLQSSIHNIRGLYVMLDEDLAKLYHVEIHRLNEQVKRNQDRFPKQFCFQLTEVETTSLRSQFAILNESYQNQTSLRSPPVTLEKGRGQHRKFAPYVFTEQGVAMLSAVLRSQTAVRVSIQIMEAFVEMRHTLNTNALTLSRIDIVEKRQITFETDVTRKFEHVFDALEKADQSSRVNPKEGIFFDGQVHDAHTFVSGLIRGAEKSIVLIDNYIDDTILTLFGKRKPGIPVMIYTRTLTEVMKLDLAKHNAQFPGTEIRVLKEAHDRFLIVDDALYHFGASLKDLGRKWFAFSRFEQGAKEVLTRLGLTITP